MKLEIKGTLLKVTKETGTSAKGTWEKYFVWVLVGEKEIMVSYFGDKWAYLQKLEHGEDVTAIAYLQTREYNGKGYTDVSGVDLKGGEVAKVVHGNAKMDKEFDSKVKTDDLSF